MRFTKNIPKFTFLSVFLLLITVTFSSCSDDDGVNADSALSIFETAETTTEFSMLAQALEDTELDDVLRTQENLTVFAPTNQAFEALPTGYLEGLNDNQLSQILQYHVISGQIASSDLSAEQAVESLLGDAIYVTAEDGEVTVNNAASVINADIGATNGIIHAIDGVLLPNSFQNVVELAGKNYSLSTLVSLIADANLVSTLEGDGPFTVFAPTNEAFEEVSGVLSDLSPEQVREVLTYHVVPAEALSSSLEDGATVTTVQGEDISVSVGGSLMLNNSANVTSADIEGVNGVVHVIDAVLLPPSYSQNVTEVEIANVGSTAWEFTAINGDDASAELNSENTDLSLTTGERYTFTNNGGSSHPLEFRNSNGDVLLSQNDTNGSFENDSNVNFQVDGNEVSFTLTEELAAEIASYYCSVHASMNGNVTIQ